jgi:GT2 family glycosyltransferase
MKLYVIIVTYNGIQWIEKCLLSVINSSIKLNIIIVDNNSNDETISLIQKKYPEVLLFPQKKNLGFGKANNLGISYALKNNCDYVFLLNQDAYLEKNTIEKLISVHKNNLDYGILSPIHLNGDGSKLDRNFSFNLTYDNNNYFYFDAIVNKLKIIYPIPFVNAAAWLLPKETLKKVGGFDPLFFHYGEDDNYCQRVLFHNFKIGVVSKSYVMHDRENITKRFFKTEADKLKHYELIIKLELSNLNFNIEKRVNILKREQQKIILKLLLQFKFKQIGFIVHKLKILNRIEPEVNVSRKINKNIGKHYL